MTNRTIEWPTVARTLILIVVAMSLLAMAGCQPVAKVDTNGDGAPDRSMTEAEIVVWQRQDAERAKIETAKLQREAERRMQRIESANVNEIQDAKDEYSDKLDSLRVDFVARDDARRLALADIEAQRTVIDSILSSPIVQGAAGGFPGGSALLGLAGVLLGGVAGNARGRKVGEDAGWNDRAQHQNEIDKAWEEATARKAGL